MQHNEQKNMQKGLFTHLAGHEKAAPGSCGSGSDFGNLASVGSVDIDLGIQMKRLIFISGNSVKL